MNSYNDDVIWMCIACIRAYEITGNAAYRGSAKSNFDMVWKRGYDSVLGGGIWWNTNRREKNTCINMPAAIAAYKLSVALGDSSYLEKARNLFTWGKENLFDTATGQVFDNKRGDGTVDRTPYTYNAGTFIGTANYLGDTESARKALDYMKAHLTNGGILKSENASHDQGGFKGIFCRWASHFVKERGLGSTYDSWLQQNATAAWGNRDLRNLVDKDWSARTGPGTLISWSCSSAVVLLQFYPAGP